MICTWLNGIFCTLSRKRGVPADTIKGVLFFKILKKDPTAKQRPRKYFASSIRGIRHQLSLSLQWRRVGECWQREFLFLNLRKGGLFSKIWEKEFFVAKIMDSPIEFHICRDTFCITGVEGGEVKGLIAMASAIKGGLFF